MPTAFQAVLHVIQVRCLWYFRCADRLHRVLGAHLIPCSRYVFVIFTCRSPPLSACLGSIKYIAKDATRDGTAHQFCMI